MRGLYTALNNIFKRRPVNRSITAKESANHTSISRRSFLTGSNGFDGPNRIFTLQNRNFVALLPGEVEKRSSSYLRYVSVLGMGFVLYYFYGKKQNSAKLSERLENFFSNCTEKAVIFLDKVFPPDSEPLLPDFKELNYPPNLPTLVIDLDKVIAKLEYDRRTGWQVLKRPGADQFFKELVNYYEIVIWSDDNYPMAADVAHKWGLPVIGCIHRDQCKRFKGKFIKDISRLGRNLNRTIIIDHDKTATMMHPDNSIIIREFSGNEDDRELHNLVDMLKSIAVNPQDVRVQLKNLGGGDADIGRRYQETKKRIDTKSETRRQIGRSLGFSTNNNTSSVFKQKRYT